MRPELGYRVDDASEIIGTELNVHLFWYRSIPAMLSWLLNTHMQSSSAENRCTKPKYKTHSVASVLMQVHLDQHDERSDPLAGHGVLQALSRVHPRLEGSRQMN
jgi:hypothetical protein